MTIQLATIEDVDALFQLNEAFNGVNCTTKELLANSISNNQQEIVAIAYMEETAIGFICGQLFQSMCYQEYYAEITELYVADEYRKQGIATALLRFMEDYFCNQNIRSFQLFTGKENVTAQACYEKFGYQRSEEIMYRKRL